MNITKLFKSTLAPLAPASTRRGIEDGEARIGGRVQPVDDMKLLHIKGR